MTINDHIAAIKERLKAIEAEKQPKQPKPKRYLVVEIKTDDLEVLKIRTFAQLKDMADLLSLDRAKASCAMGLYQMAWLSLGSLIDSGKIITVNEE